MKSSFENRKVILYSELFFYFAENSTKGHEEKTVEKRAVLP